MRARTFWLLAGLGLLTYAFLFDNANSYPAAAGSSWTPLMQIPKQIRGLELGLVLVLVAAALHRRVSRISQTLITCMLVFFSIGLSSYLLDGDVPILDGVRLMYMFVLPACIFMIGREAPWDDHAWTRIASLVFVWVAVSAVVSWVQFGVLGYAVGDDITGLNKDAHANGTLMMFAALAALAYALFRKRREGFALSVFFLVTMVLSSVLKVMFLGIAAVLVIIAFHIKSLPKARATVSPVITWGAPALIAVVIAGAAFTQLDVLSSNRLGTFGETLLSDPLSLGPVQAHEVALRRIGRDLTTLALGVGPFRFANPISVGQVTGSLSNKASGDLMAIGDEKGEQARVTLSSSLLGEFGVPAFCVILFMYASIGRTLWRGRHVVDPEVRQQVITMSACGLVLASIPLTSLFGSLEVLSVSWPVMLLAGIACQRSERLGTDVPTPDGSPDRR